jgi:hypothetical protein
MQMLLRTDAYQGTKDISFRVKKHDKIGEYLAQNGMGTNYRTRLLISHSLVFCQGIVQVFLLHIIIEREPPEGEILYPKRF